MNLGGNFDVPEILLEHLHRGIERSHVNRQWQPLFRSQIRNLKILDTLARTHTHTHTHTHARTRARARAKNTALVFCEMVFEKTPILQVTHMEWCENILNYLFQYPK